MKRVALVCFCTLITGCSGLGTIKLAESPSGLSPSGVVVLSSRIKVKFKAAVIKGSGDISPVARQDFTATPYSDEKLKLQLEIKNKPGARPVKQPFKTSPEPDITARKYADASDLGAYSRDFEAWLTANTKAEKDAQFQYDRNLETWEAKAYVGLEDAEKKASGGASSVTFKTNLSGEADLTLNEGTWYFSGKYTLLQGTSNIFWLEVPIVIAKDTTSVELSNDNGQVINTKS